MYLYVNIYIYICIHVHTYNICVYNCVYIYIIQVQLFQGSNDLHPTSAPGSKYLGGGWLCPAPSGPRAPWAPRAAAVMVRADLHNGWWLVRGVYQLYNMFRSTPNISGNLQLLGIPTNRRKFRSQTSDNMDRWKSRGGKSQGGEAKKWEDQRRERVRSKKM